MAKKEKAKKSEAKEEFTPDLSLASPPTGLLDALKGADEPVIESPKRDESDNPLIDVSILPKERNKKTRKPYTKRNKPPIDEDLDLLDGEDIQMIIDIIVPMAIAGIHNMTNKEKMSPDGIMLTEKQEKKMNRICQRVADRIKTSVNPFVALAVAGLTAYGGNYLKAKP